MAKSYLVNPAQKPLFGCIDVPGDKSITHRVLLLAAIADGPSYIRHALKSEDTLHTQNVLRQLGVRIDTDDSSDGLLVHGVGKHGLRAQAKQELECGNAGTLMRLLTGLLAGAGVATTLVGDASLSKRPMQRIIDPLNHMGLDVAALGANQTAPLRIRKRAFTSGIEYTLPVASAQVKSAILLAGLYSQSPVIIHEPVPTRDHTERWLREFGVCLHKEAQTISLKPGATIHAGEVEVPGDMSSAAFFIVAASIVPDSDIVLKGVCVNPTRSGVIALLQQMGANIQLRNERFIGPEPCADIYVQSAQLEGIDFPLEQVTSTIDEFPALFIAAACAKGKTTLRGAKELRVKESDRIATMAEGLRTLGIVVEEFDDGLVIEGGKLTGGTVNSYQDHRVAMAFCTAGLVANNPVNILNVDNIATSLPQFSELAQQMGCDIVMEKRSTSECV